MHGPPPRYRTFGPARLQISEIGFGAWGIGGGLWKGGSDDEALKALHAACDQGLNFIDTALAYGQGHSERLIGRLLSEHPTSRQGAPLYVATKIPPKNREWPARRDISVYETFPRDHILSSTEQSLKHLGVERIDLQQLHVWSARWVNEPIWYETLLELQRAGKVAHFGISINDHDPDSVLEVVQRGWVHSVQVIYNIFDPTPAAHLFPLCRQKHVGVIARCPFDEGSLTGAVTEATHFEEGDFRADYFTPNRKKEIVKRVEQLKGLLDEASVKTLSELALRFCLSHPDLSTVIPGMRTVGHVHDNLAVSDGVTLTAPILAKLAKHAWPRNFY